ncbi:ExeM/NucH family extracellular endonuclease [Rhizobium sp. XQZ8]|uniref:ExeM/NucH family extracellular endonuclease n=1 Tax=Rhizobium populisoli TaxID=2859785 RepID=UPI001CA50E27|nr:ExeM/NucH family extracellular endonuclease [Rhizobium populisoli]MBW6421353.1 ExeM/NucH family extracellular endonuclease [Rhizobium populisoli]
MTRPVAVDDDFSMNVKKQIFKGNLLKNDYDVDGDDVFLRFFDGVRVGDKGVPTVDGTYGTFTFDANGKFTYELDLDNPAVAGLGKGEALIEKATYKISDGHGDTDVGYFSLVINGRNDAPVITSATDIMVAENEIDTGLTVTATDPDVNDTLTYGIVDGGDSDLFTIDPTTGKLSFINAPDFENPLDANGDNSYQVTVSANDGHKTVVSAVSVEVTDVIEQVATPRINEIHYDNAGADSGEFVEIRVTAGEDVSGMQVEFYNGSNGAQYGNVAPVSAMSMTSDGTYDYYVLNLPQDGIQNGSPDALSLSKNGEVIEFLSYEGTLTATNGTAAGMASTDIGVSETTSTPAGQSLQRTGDGPTEWTGPVDATKGGANDGDTGPGEPGTPMLISEIQGTGTASLVEGQTVKVSAVVTHMVADGFFLQEEASDNDGNALTSEGIFVFTGGTPTVAIGSLVELSGTVDEYFGLTELTDISGLTTVSTGHALPDYADVVLPNATADALEKFEGMRVSLSSSNGEDLTVTGNFNLQRYGEIEVSAGQKVQPTQVYDAQTQSGEIDALTEQNSLNRIIIDDGITAQNPDEFKYIGVDAAHGDNGNGYLDSGDHFTGDGPTLRNGAEITAPIKGVMTYGFDSYRMNVDGQLSVDEATNSGVRTDAPADTGGDLTVSSFNVLNYFTTLGDRGAVTEADFARQTAKIVDAMKTIDADVFGLEEIQNNGFGSESAIATLVDALNDAYGSDVYEYVTYEDHATGATATKLGTDAITSGLIYKTGELTLTGSDYLEFDDGAMQRNRPSVLGTFEDKDTGEVFSVNANHFKSKGASGLTDASDPNYDQDDGQSFWNDVRTDAANQLTEWLASDPTKSGDSDVLVIGDLNSYMNEDPIQAIEAAGYANIVKDMIGDDAFSYIFDGQWGTLDHGLASETLAGQVTGATEWHINSQEPNLLAYSTEFKDPGFYSADPYAASDHDPLIIGLKLGQNDCVLA